MDMQIVNNKYMKYYDKNKERHIFNIGIQIIYMDLFMLQKFPIKNFKWVRDISKFDGRFIKSYNKESTKGYFLEVDVQYPGTLHNLFNDLPYCLKE